MESDFTVLQHYTAKNELISGYIFSKEDQQNAWKTVRELSQSSLQNPIMDRKLIQILYLLLSKEQSTLLIFNPKKTIIKRNGIFPVHGATTQPAIIHPASEIERETL